MIRSIALASALASMMLAGCRTPATRDSSEAAPAVQNPQAQRAEPPSPAPQPSAQPVPFRPVPSDTPTVQTSPPANANPPPTTNSAPPPPTKPVAAAPKPVKPSPSPVATPASKPAVTPAAPTAAPAPTAAAPAPAAAVQKAASLDLNSLEQRLKDTRAIGVFTKLSLKNQVDDLLGDLRDFHKGSSKTSQSVLRQKYDLLIIKVLSLLQDGDPPLASAIASSREALWQILMDPTKFAKI
jgi:hypothetical protein